VFARHLGHRLYRGEYFAMQSDAHITFVKGWDNEIIEQWHSANNEMAVLSTYLSGVEGHINEETGERISKSRPIMCDSDFEGAGEYKHLRHGQQPEGVPYIHDTPMLNPYWAAGFSFGRGHFVVNVPYDQHLVSLSTLSVPYTLNHILQVSNCLTTKPWIFQGEEISMGLRGFS
jgi:[Skp1-protein]-hydroxyproline N-acetylglucosaminyltransferase